jgi:hypothetical protein
MSCLQGYVKATFSQICEIMGAPDLEESGDGKVSTEFVFTDFESNEIRIYDWKEYDGGERCRSEAVYEWHVGGRTPYVIEVVNEMLDAEGYEMTATRKRT